MNFKRPAPQQNPSPSRAEPNSAPAALPELYPLSWLAIDLDAKADELAAQLGDRVRRDDWHRPAVDTATARELVIEYQDQLLAAAAAAEQAQRERRERMAAMPSPAQHVAAIAERQAQLRADGVDEGSALELIGAAGDSYTAQAQAERDERLDDYWHGGGGRWLSPRRNP